MQKSVKRASPWRAGLRELHRWNDPVPSVLWAPEDRWPGLYPPRATAGLYQVLIFHLAEARIRSAAKLSESQPGPGHEPQSALIVPRTGRGWTAQRAQGGLVHCRADPR